MTALAALQAAGAAVYHHEAVLIMGTADRLGGTNLTATKPPLRHSDS